MIAPTFPSLRSRCAVHALDTGLRLLHRIQTLSAVTFLAACALALMSASAQAQDGDPVYSYENPSDEMDFELPPTPDLKDVAPPPIDPQGQVDNFFSDAPVLDIPEEPQEKAEQPPVEAPPPVEEKPKKIVHKAPPAPPYNFKTVVLPSTIYRKAYTPDNRHLPVARYHSDMERGVIGSAMRADIGAMRALKNIGTPVDVIAENGEPSLTVAARNADAHTVHWLLIQGASVNAPAPGGMTALHYAAYRGDAAMAELLLSYGADMRATDDRGATPIKYATLSGSPETVAILRKFGAEEETASLQR